MKSDSIRKHPLIAGTMLLTLAGVLSRVIGFFYRIFLSQRIGAEGMGIYQLTVPIYVLTISVTSSAIQTAISRFVAQAAVSADARDAYLHDAEAILLDDSPVIPVLCRGGSFQLADGLTGLYRAPDGVYFLQNIRQAVR